MSGNLYYSCRQLRRVSSSSSCKNVVGGNKRTREMESDFYSSSFICTLLPVPLIEFNLNKWNVIISSRAPPCLSLPPAEVGDFWGRRRTFGRWDESCFYYRLFIILPFPFNPLKLYFSWKVYPALLRPFVLFHSLVKVIIVVIVTTLWIPRSAALVIVTIRVIVWMWNKTVIPFNLNLRQLYVSLSSGTPLNSHPPT